MSGSHPKDILELRKTMTRRTWGLKTINRDPGGWQLVAVFQDGLARFISDTGVEVTLKCPYGGVGDRLWVRETWAIKDCGNRVPLTSETWPEGWPIKRLQYLATDPPPIPPELADDSKEPYWWSKRPSIHMPRWASRILLEITELSAERLQEITEEDAIKEGFQDAPGMTEGGNIGLGSATYWFMKRWNELNAKRGYGWDESPWVWPIGFKQITLQ